MRNLTSENVQRMECCPAHDDHRPSLSVWEKPDGRRYYRCFAGCSPERLADAMGLAPGSWQVEGHDKMTLLVRPNGNGRRPAGATASGLTLAVLPADDSKPEADSACSSADPLEWLADYCAVSPDFLKALPVEVRGGRLAFTFGDGVKAAKLREAGKKDYSWEPSGGATPPLWPMPENALPKRIWLTEGETDCITARFLGLDAYALTKGARTPLDEAVLCYLSHLGVREVCLLMDCDDAGRKGASMLEDACRKAGLSPQRVDLAASGIINPLLGEKDLRDAWRASGDAENLRSRIETSLPTYTHSPLEVKLWVCDASELVKEQADAEPPSLPLLGMPGYIMEGWSHILAGYPKAGKTELLYTCVREWLSLGVGVLWLTEESRSVWSQRVLRHGGLAKGLQLVFALGENPEELLSYAEGRPEPVVIVDTVRNLLQIEDENDNAKVSAALGRWEARLKGRTRIYVHHERKMPGEHGHAIAGGGAFLGAVDRAIELHPDASSDKRRKLVVRSRICEAPELLYELTDSGLQALGEPDSVSREEVARRVVAVLNDEWKTTKEVREALDPMPSLEQVRKALEEARKKGLIQRDPEEDRQGATYRWRGVSPSETSLPTYTLSPLEVRLHSGREPARDGGAEADMQLILAAWGYGEISRTAAG